ncbi:TetR/AcrR family transcriptional regulator C-terminal domain-containing protein [Kribbella sp. NPDC023855]|uniref:TetR/AcrR family transcriptional regulator C-terminal domain-containing protein n=1 Tax=Kribbella sp. NPDC023855 TaxID=3154698 RepID=UPI0033D4EE8D
MTELIGQGDAARTLALLWGKVATPKRGPRHSIGSDEVIAAAVRVADRQGLPAVTMRAVGNELGRTAMSLYTYVLSREVMVDLMYDSVHAEFAGPRNVKDWRKAIANWCTRLRDLYLAHPWLLEVSSARPVLGPKEQEVLESLLRVLAKAGLPLEDRPAATSALFSVVRGAAKQASEARAAVTEEDAEWWAERAQALAVAAPDFAERFPESTAMATQQRKGGPQPWIRAADQAFTGAVALIVDGLAQRVEAATE